MIYFRETSIVYTDNIYEAKSFTSSKFFLCSSLQYFKQQLEESFDYKYSNEMSLVYHFISDFVKYVYAVLLM